MSTSRHYLHEGAGDVWERFEEWLMNEYAYDPCRDLLIINGDAASWISHFAPSQRKSGGFFRSDVE
ncbi:hypothetical protein B9L21_09500 [Geobacillus uzenensis]|uniref:Uncharacterized protein n=1 Tax=Geobacillus uzenensis TaxID=129339 RepID=A0ABX4DGQ2_9BACL|nr:hypothetical protein B9L21_09500 [Geobacillus uzenensis]